MFIEIVAYKRYIKIATITLWAALGLMIAASVLDAMFKMDMLVLLIRLLFAVFILAGSARSVLFALSPIPGKIPAQVRLVYGFILAFVLLIIGLWMLYLFFMGTSG